MDIEINITDEDIRVLSELEGWTFDEDRQNILKSIMSIDVQACPGSGKTTLIAAKLILLSQQWIDRSRGICVLSHTNVAKNEIIDRLKKTNIITAQKLLNYPHFIGIIQDFVDRFIALPLIKTKHDGNIIIDNDIYTDIAWDCLSQQQFSYLRGTLNGLGDETKKRSFLRSAFLRFDQDGNLNVNMSAKSRAWNSSEKLDRANSQLKRLKTQIGKKGVFLFRDMFTLSELAFNRTPILPDLISSRFPLVFIDEMQDTQLHQDEVLLRAFGSKNYQVIIQRFGDPDQAIFHGSGSEKPNESYNDKTDLDFVVNASHRFDENIASQIKCLSLNQVELTSVVSQEEQSIRISKCSCSSGFQNTVIIQDCGNHDSVIQRFASIVDEQFSAQTKAQDDLTVKIVGAVGKPVEKDTDLKISSYWTDYSKEKSQKSFKAISLLNAVQHCQTITDTDWTSRYQILIKSILKLLGTLNQKHTIHTLKVELNSKDQFYWRAFRSLILGALLVPETVKGNWECWVSNLLGVLGVKESNLSNEAKEFLLYTERAEAEHGIGDAKVMDENMSSIGNNCLQHKSGFIVEFSTIHGVKGETHDATLILPTKYHDVDMQKMIPYLTNEGNGERKGLGIRNTKFMKQFYVAASRPRHLLCMAIESEYINDDHIKMFEKKGWQVVSTASNKKAKKADLDPT